MTRVYGCALLLAVMFLPACYRRKPVVPPTPAPVVLGPPAPSALPAPAPPRPLDAPSQELVSGNYSEAVRGFEQYLQRVPIDGERDQALFHLGILYALPSAPFRDWKKATDYLNQLVKESPSSPLRPAAQIILSLRGEVVQAAADGEKRDQRIRQLNTELERLIRIDSQRRGR